MLGACSSQGVESELIDKDLLSAEVQAQLTKELSMQAPTVDCPEDLKPKVGATTTCVLNAPTGAYDVTVTVTRVNLGDAGNFQTGNALFDVKVADQPK